MAGSGHFLSFFGGLFVTVLYSPKKERVLAELHRDSSYLTMGKGGWVKAWETGASPTAPPPATRILPFLEWWSSARSLGKSVMIESPLIREIVAEVRHKDILKFLTRFGPVPPELEAQVKSIFDESVLDAVVELSTSCPDLEHFQAEMRAIPRPPEPWDPADEPEPKA